MMCVLSRRWRFAAQCLAVVSALSFSKAGLASEASDVSTDVRCFSADDDSVALELRLYSDSEMWVGGQVLYRGGDDFIPIVFSYRAIEEDIPGRPSKYKEVWEEVLGGKVSGLYELYIQGVNIYDVVYVDKQSGERVHISEETQPENTWLDIDGVCPW